ncbi:MAG: hypothetical protein EBU90_23475 [Proteobacteria bacterium]|nr:hypothetical protein [Pseudomonadota bacterium]NBP16585.1 hypothetical protein [bacterium]
MSEVIKLNSQDFEFTCTFFNATQGDDSALFNPISYGAFEFIEIVDNMFSPFLSCKFGINNPLNFIEKQPGNKPFAFKGNNRNLCNINLVPTEVKNSDKDIHHKNILNVFGVLNEGAVVSANTTDSSIVIYDLIDTKEAALLEKKVGFVYPKVDSTISVAQNIKNLIKQIHPQEISDNDLFDTDTFNIGDKQGAQITTNYPFPLHYTLLDAIQFLLPFNIASVNGIESQLFLKYDYDIKKYSNYSIYDIFNNAQSSRVNQETFIIGGKEGAGSNNTDNKTVPVNNIITKTFKENMIHNVSFSNVNFKISNQELLPIYYTTTTDPTNINTLSYVDLNESIKLFETNVLNTTSMKKIYGDNNIVLNVDLDETKVAQQNYKMISSPFNKEVNEKLAKVQLYNSFIFQNMTLNFTVPGQPFRQAGVFINIARSADTEGSEFDKKLLGQWLVTDVTHKITKSTYNTFIQCVKPFRIK